MKTNELENREIGELISEITEKGFEGMTIDALKHFKPDHPPIAYVSVTNHDLPDDEGTLHIEAGSLVECLRLIVDMIRRQRGEPSLAEEVAALMLQQETHESLPPIICGDNASCRCGSDAPLEFEVKAVRRVSWKTGQSVGMGYHIPAVEPGEIGRCPDCGLWYQLTA